MAVSPVDTDIHESRCRSLFSMYRRCPQRVKEMGPWKARKLLCLVDVGEGGRRCLGPVAHLLLGVKVFVALANSTAAENRVVGLWKPSGLKA